MTVRELGQALVYYALVGTVAAVAATVAPIPFDGLPASVATVDAVILSGWAATVALDGRAARTRGGRS
jgi:hypothetical protein